MAKGHSREKRPQKKAGEVKDPRTLSETKQKSLAAIKTAGDLSKLLNETNIAQVDVEELLSEIIEEEVEELDDTVLGEDPDNDELREENDDLEDDYKDYDEIEYGDPFDIEDREKADSPLYIVAVSFVKGGPMIEFLRVPQYDTNDTLVRNALIARYSLFHEIAAFIAGAQKCYFETRDEGSLVNLNQQDLVKSLEKRKYNLSKVHVSRMLDVLYFKIEGSGTIPSKYFFKRYGTVIGLNKDEKVVFAREFLCNCDKNMNRLEKAKGLVKFIEQKKKITIKLSENQNEHDKYKQFKNIIQQVEGAKA